MHYYLDFSSKSLYITPVPFFFGSVSEDYIWFISYNTFFIEPKFKEIKHWAKIGEMMEDNSDLPYEFVK